jgi:hypothetical protein
MALRSCDVSFKDHRGVRHAVEVQAESLYEAVVLAIKTFRGDPWLERVAPGTTLDVEVREPGTKHSITLAQVERWLASTSSSPLESGKKNKLKVMLVQNT